MTVNQNRELFEAALAVGRYGPESRRTTCDDRGLFDEGKTSSDVPAAMQPPLSCGSICVRHVIIDP
jgi:hypothetical protein